MTIIVTIISNSIKNNIIIIIVSAFTIFKCCTVAPLTSVASFQSHNVKSKHDLSNELERLHMSKESKLLRQYYQQNLL